MGYFSPKNTKKWGSLHKKLGFEGLENGVF